jgi:hypothetical protein
VFRPSCDLRHLTEELFIVFIENMVFPQHHGELILQGKITKSAIAQVPHAK